MKNEIIFDFTNLTDHSVGEQGISDALVSGIMDKASTIDKDMKERRQRGVYPFRGLPYRNVENIIDFAGLAKSRFENFVNVGYRRLIAGRSGAVMSLCHPYHNLVSGEKRNGLRMFFADNIDPDLMTGMFEILEPSKTLFNVITKSGSTAETMGTFLILRAFLEKAVGNKWRDNVVITTDAEKGDLRAIASEESFRSFIVPDSVGGRFSVFSPVGLIPAACAGIDIKELLSGAEIMDKRIETTDVSDNPAYLYSIYHYLLDTLRGKNISVMMPYATGLYGLADWNRQLWAESLGKKRNLSGETVNVGQTPIKALGATDQHSQVQLYVEGPYDKVFTILSVGAFKNELPMPPAYQGRSSLDYLCGAKMESLMESERLGTIYALTKNNRPNMNIAFPAVNPSTVGQFIYALEVATVFSGGLYNIDPLDQPGVEGGKIAAFALMGRKGYEEKAAEIKKGLESLKQYIK